jgi:putative spermidine/putrescine transport system permease protein
MKVSSSFVSWLQVSPLALVLALFFGVPMLVVLVVSFFDFQQTSIVPAFILDNYRDIFTSDVTVRLYLSTLRFALIVWALTLVIGFTLANFLVFHVRNLVVKLALFALVSVPFWTSNIIRMIAWIPFLGRNGLLNAVLMDAHMGCRSLALADPRRDRDPAVEKRHCARDDLCHHAGDGRFLCRAGTERRSGRLGRLGVAE